MRSVVVVFPASMCAMMPMLRVFSSVKFLGTFKASSKVDQRAMPRGRTHVPRRMQPLEPGLPAIVGEGLVGLRHLVGIFFLLDGVATHLRGVQELPRQLLAHGLFRPPLGA